MQIHKYKYTQQAKYKQTKIPVYEIEENTNIVSVVLKKSPCPLFICNAAVVEVFFLHPRIPIWDE